MEAVSFWLVGLSHKVANCSTPGGPGASAGSLVGGVRVQKTLGLLPAHWWVKPGPRVSARLLAGRARSWSLAAGPRVPRASVRLLVVGVQFVTQLGMGSKLS